MSHGIIAKNAMGRLETFARVMPQEGILQSWKIPVKVIKKRTEDGMLYSKTKGKFLTELAINLSSKEPASSDSHLLEAELLTVTSC